MVTAASRCGLRPRKAAEFIGVGLSTFWRYTKTREDFPKGVPLARNVTVFFEDELRTWLNNQADKQRAVEA
ncbi:MULTISPECIES: helix-turn-helix transcriptional regulator [Burkholderia]|uniref:helix-turn-helix transcriptional regulator n=1 Tax=Burkholderia TaxID=32008 RepID=UPI0005A05F7D|nr:MULTISPECIES: AlpA family phage regulatory protein [Burkholderia]ARK90048.1 hypothetical protein BOC42_20995 [Burkholderia pseudomallei]VWC39487.1 hypothetical protein BLA6993_06945 [Burkholderia lata]